MHVHFWRLLETYFIKMSSGRMGKILLLMCDGGKGLDQARAWGSGVSERT